MAEIAAVPWNGLNVVSTFSGCGGSCLGFKMAGYRVLWANEFVPAAADTYRANHSGTILSTDDIRAVSPEAIREAIGNAPVDVLEGSPPCASFSTAGRGSHYWGDVRKYSDVSQRVDDLFFEYARIISGLQPRAFVAENVSGLARGVAKGYFKMIHAALVAAGYRVEARMLDAQWLGVPQVRRRVIFVGVRNDLGQAPVFPDPFPYRYSITDALTSLPAVKARRVAIDEEVPDNVAASLDGYAVGDEWDKLGRGGQSERYFSLVRPDPDLPIPTVTASGAPGGVASVTHPSERRKFAIAELRRLSGFPDDFILTGSYSQRWERLGRSVSPPVMHAVAARLAEVLLPRKD